MGALAFDAATNTLYEGTGEGNNYRDSYYGSGLYRSADFGSRWASLNNPALNGAAITKIAIVPSSGSSRTIYYGVTYAYSMNRADADLIEGDSGTDGLWRATSTDSGASWSHWRYSDSEGLTRSPGKPGRAAEYASALTGHARPGEASVTLLFHKRRARVELYRF